MSDQINDGSRECFDDLEEEESDELESYIRETQEAGIQPTVLDSETASKIQSLLTRRQTLEILNLPENKKVNEADTSEEEETKAKAVDEQARSPSSMTENDAPSPQSNADWNPALELMKLPEILFLPKYKNEMVWDIINKLRLLEETVKAPLNEARCYILNQESDVTIFSSNDNFNNFLNQIDRALEETNWLIISNRNSFICYQFIGAALGALTAISLLSSAPIGLGLYFLSATLGTICGVGMVQLLARKNSYWHCCLFKPPQQFNDFAEKLKKDIPPPNGSITIHRNSN